MAGRSMADIRELFAAEAEQRLARLGQLVLELEQRPHDSGELVAEIFREVHTLKGAAAVVGFDRVGDYAHEVEGRLEQLRSGTATVTAAIADALLIAVDRLGIMIGVAVRGEENGEDPQAAAAVALLTSAFSPSADPVARVAHEESIDHVVPSPVAATAAGIGTTREGGGTIMVPIGRLDELVRMVGEAATGLLRVGRVITERLGVHPDSVTEFGELSRLLSELQERATRTLMVPVATITDQLQRAVRDAARTLGKDVHWEVRGASTELDRNVLHQLADSLLHLVRNSVDHGIESPAERTAAGKPATAVVRLHAMQLGSEVIIAITDDGGGINIDAVRQRATRMGIDSTEMSDDQALQLIFHSGLSTASFVSDISGRGVGLDVVRASVEAARGRVEVRSTPGVGSEFRIIVPITLAVLHCLLVESAGQRFALPLHRVALALACGGATESHMEGRPVILLGTKPVPVADLAEVLRLPADAGTEGTLVVINGTVGQQAFRVDALIGQRDVVVKALSKLMPHIDFVAGTSVEPDGSILLVLDPVALTERAGRTTGRNIGGADVAPNTALRRGRILVVDDALTVRELQREILQRAGFDVRVASDGVEALEQLEADIPDLVLTDIEMPRMNGFELTVQIRSREAFKTLPILILTSLASDADRQRGMDAGADGYIVKSAFDEPSLLAAVDRMIGVPT